MRNAKKYNNNSQSAKNLEKSLSDEALGHVKYTLWGNEAEKNGYPQIAHYYRVAANNELSHAKLWMEELGMILSTNENLQSAISEESQGQQNYITYASVAEDEGYNDLGSKFLNTSKVEKNHMEGFSGIYKALTDDQMFVSDDCSTMWRCYNCGYLSQGENPPQSCPLCGRPETWFTRGFL